MQLEMLCVCRRPPSWVGAATADYARRMPRELPLEISFVAPAHASRPTVERRRDEAARLLKRVKPDTLLVALDGSGTEADSATVAQWLAAWCHERSRVALAIGGDDGHGEAVLERAALRWSLSRLTLPHRLVQLVLAEQLYRASTILAGHPYHRA